jgi:hypothetical protein
MLEVLENLGAEAFKFRARAISCAIQVSRRRSIGLPRLSAALSYHCHSCGSL